MDRDKFEQELKERRLTAPRITPEDIDKSIRKVEYYIFPESQLTVCCITLKNGFNVTGESACASPENFNKEIGERISYQQAKNKIWMLEGYLLKEQLYKLKENNDTN